MVDTVVVEADGGSRGNPGPSGYGAVVFDAATGEVLAERSEPLGITTNNVAEYSGLIAGLRAARDLGASRVRVRMDSKLVVEQMKGVWQVKNEGLRPLHREASQLRQGFADVTFTWIPRAQNAHADRLANAAMDAAAGIAPKVTAAAPVASTGPVTTLVLVRHGATVHSHRKRLSGRNELPLDDAGRAQAAALARRHFGDVAAVVSSPLRRTVETAEAIGGALGVPVSLDPGFAEVDFGAFEGLTMAEARERHPGEAAAWSGSSDVAPPDGESFTELDARVLAARAGLVAAYPGATVVVVTHVFPIKALVCASIGAPFASFYRLRVDIASVSQLEARADGSGSLRLFNDTSHLR